MQTGIVTSESLSPVLRGISQKRKQGTLEITEADRKLTIYFMLGKIVEVTEEGIHPVAEVKKLLEGAGCDLSALGDEPFESYRALFLALNADTARVVDEQLFGRAVRCHVLDKLYSVRLKDGAYYTFTPQMVEYDKDFSPGISVGQLLLDLVAIDSDRQRFTELFPPEILIGRSEKKPTETPSPEELIIFELLDGAAMKLETLARRSLLSTYHLQDTLLRLYDFGLVTVTNPSASSILNAAIVSGLESSIDSAFESLEGDPLDIMFEEPHENPSGGSSGGTFSEPPPGAHLALEKEMAQDDQPMVINYFGRRASILGAKLLTYAWVPHLIVLFFLTMAALAPFYLWGGVFSGFSQ